MVGRASLKIQGVVLQASCSPLFSNLGVLFYLFYFKYIQSVLVPKGAQKISHHPQTQPTTFLGKDRIDPKDVTLFMTTGVLKPTPAVPGLMNCCLGRAIELPTSVTIVPFRGVSSAYD